MCCTCKKRYRILKSISGAFFNKTLIFSQLSYSFLYENFTNISWKWCEVSINCCSKDANGKYMSYHNDLLKRDARNDAILYWHMLRTTTEARLSNLFISGDRVAHHYLVSQPLYSFTQIAIIADSFD